MTTFKEQIENLGNGDKLNVASLKFLSDLNSEDRDTLRVVWPSLPPQRRAQIVSALAIIAEDNIDYHFRRVFLNALDDTSADVRRKAIEGLSEDNSTLLLGRLLTLLRNDPDEDVREASATALGRFTYLAQCNKLGIQSEESHLRSTLIASARDRAEDEDVRRRAVESLGYFNQDKEVQELIADQYKQGEKHAESAVFAMGRTTDKEWTPIIMHELNNTRPAMRYEAAHAAGEIVIEDAVPRLIELISDPDLEVRLAAIWGLGQIGGKAASDALRNAVSSTEQAVHDAAQEALQEIAFSANPLDVV